MSLTERRIRDARPGPGTAFLWDDQIRGLGVRITKGGTKSLVLNYRERGRERRATLGRVGDVTRGDVEALVAKAPPVARNRVLALVSRLFTLAEHWEWRPQRTNPARGIERSREEARDRTLSGDEMAALSAALADMEPDSPMAVAAIRVAAVTGLRIGEVLSMRWEHVDVEAGRVLLPETKTGRRSHDLPTAALAVLGGLPRVNGWVFASRGESRITYNTARVAFRRAAERAGIEEVRLHDLRRTVMTRAAMAGVGVHVLRDLLGHRTTAIADRYIRAVGNPVREARESVGGEIAAIMAGDEPRGDAPAGKARE